jgi:nitroreductase
MKRYVVIGLAAILALAAVQIGAQSGAPRGRSNPAVDSILQSGTARTFTDRAIDDATLELIAQCGIRAPSAMNSQPWHFSVVTNKAMLAKLKEAMAAPPAPQQGAAGAGARPQGSGTQESTAQQPSRAPAPQGRRDPFFGSSTIIIISSARNSQFATFDCALACQNMSLAAQSLGLGAHISTSAVLAFSNVNEAA